nr:ATP-binding protein [Kofleriaceae bacterium]
MTAPPTTPASVGSGLGRSLVTASIVGMLLFAAIHSLVIYLTEDGEICPAAGVLEDPPTEILEQGAIALLFAAPFGIALAVMLGRRLTIDTTNRLDEVIASAAKLGGDNLHQRIPLGKDNDELDRVADAFNAMLERIEVGVAAQKQFAADASHELRTPLAVISTRIEVARRKPRDVSHWENVADETLSEVRRMNALVDKLLVLSRAGNAGLQHERVDLRALAAAAAERIAAVAKQRDIAIDVTGDGDVPADIDPNAIAIVLDNLLRNAIDHAPRGSAIIVRTDRAPAPRFAVEDRGPGVPPEMRQRIFEPFARGTHATETDRAAGEGFGLGLAICKRIVAGHHGTVVVEDRQGGGARFVVTLPATAAA